MHALMYDASKANSILNWPQFRFRDDGFVS